MFISRPDERIRGGDPLDDTPLRGRRTFLGRKTFHQVNGLACAASGEQSADAGLADGKSVEEDFVSFIRLQCLDTLSGDRVEQVRLPGLGGSTGEQNQRGTAVAGLIVQLQGLP